MDFFNKAKEKAQNLREQAKNYSQDQFDKLSPDTQQKLNERYNRARQGFNDFTQNAQNFGKNRFNQLSPERQEQLNQGYNRANQLASQGFGKFKSFASSLSDPEKRRQLQEQASTYGSNAYNATRDNFGRYNKGGRKTKKGKSKKGGRKSKKGGRKSRKH
jgi:hypothetical protein